MASRLARVWAERSRAAKVLSVIAISMNPHYRGLLALLASHGPSRYNNEFDGEGNGDHVRALRTDRRGPARPSRPLRSRGQGEGARLDLRRVLEGMGRNGGQGHQRVSPELPRPRAPRDAPEGLPGLPEGRRLRT